MTELLYLPTTENALQAQDDKSFREEFIRKSERFIRAAAGKAIHHFVTEHDDEWSIALIAFNEAIDTFLSERGKFSSFAETVIKRRLTDELRREYRIRSEIATSPDTLESGSLDPEADDYSSEVRSAMSRQAIQSYNEQAYSVKDEIEAVQSILKTYGFTFFDLTECSPKTDKTKKECARAVAALLENEELFNEMSRKKALPVKALLEKSGVKSKILERHRKYIIAAAVILNGEYPLLAEYMSYIRKSLKT